MSGPLASRINPARGLIAVHNEQAYGQYSTAFGVLTTGFQGLSTNALQHLGLLEIQPQWDFEQTPKTFSPGFSRIQEGKPSKRWYDVPLVFDIRAEDANGSGYLSFEPLLAAAGLTGGGGPDPVYTPQYLSPSGHSSFAFSAWLDNYIRLIGTGAVVETFEIAFVANQYVRATVSAKALYRDDQLQEGIPAPGGQIPLTGTPLWTPETSCPISGAQANFMGTLPVNALEPISAMLTITNVVEEIEVLGSDLYGACDIRGGIKEFRISEQDINLVCKFYKTWDDDDWNDVVAAFENGDRIGFTVRVGNAPNLVAMEVFGQITALNEGVEKGQQTVEVEIEGTFPKDGTGGNQFPLFLKFGNH